MLASPEDSGEGGGRARHWGGGLSLSGAAGREGATAVDAAAAATAAAAQVAIKYAPFAFETRPLRRLDEEEESMLMQM
jgi:hypothetical protein